MEYKPIGREKFEQTLVDKFINPGDKVGAKRIATFVENITRGSKMGNPFMFGAFLETIRDLQHLDDLMLGDGTPTSKIRTVFSTVEEKFVQAKSFQKSLDTSLENGHHSYAVYMALQEINYDKPLEIRDLEMINANYELWSKTVSAENAKKAFEQILDDQPAEIKEEISTFEMLKRRTGSILRTSELDSKLSENENQLFVVFQMKDPDGGEGTVKLVQATEDEIKIVSRYVEKLRKQEAVPQTEEHNLGKGVVFVTKLDIGISEFVAQNSLMMGLDGNNISNTSKNTQKLLKSMGLMWKTRDESKREFLETYITSAMEAAPDYSIEQPSFNFGIPDEFPNVSTPEP